MGLLISTMLVALAVFALFHGIITGVAASKS